MLRMLWACVLLAVATPAQAAGRAKYYVVVRGVDEAEGVSSGILAELRELFVAELGRHPELTLEPPPGLPEEPEAMKAELKKRKLKAFEVTLKVLSVTRELKPPAPGKQYQVLHRGIKLSVFGDTLPEKIVAIGGDGDAMVGADVGRQEDLEREAKVLLLDCAKEAVKQAVDMTVHKLNLAGKAGAKKKKS